VIGAYLQGDPEIAENALAEALGVSKNTVLAARRRLEASETIEEVTKNKGMDTSSGGASRRGYVVSGESAYASEVAGGLLSLFQRKTRHSRSSGGAVFISDKIHFGSCRSMLQSPRLNSPRYCKIAQRIL
jgi:DNA-binding transcriptional MocR family regulator